MNLNNFQEFIDDVILKRGKDYFKKGHVEKIEEIGPNHYVVEVEGSENYTVEIIIDDHKNIMETSCNCPYDFGEYCKHQVAAFFALGNNAASDSKSAKQSKEKKVDLPTLLSHFSKDKLQSIIIDFAQEYPEFEKRLLFQYAPAKNELATSKKLIKDYIRKATSRGFIAWNRVSDALIGVYMTLEKARERVETGETENAVSLCLLAQSAVMDMLGYCDDSNGEVSVVMNRSFDIINDAVLSHAHQMDEHQQQKLYEIIMKEALGQGYEEWTDWKLNLFQSCVNLAFNPIIRQKLETELARMIETSKKDDSWSTGYLMGEVKLLQLELLERFDGEEKALQFIHDNIRYSDFREKAIIHQLRKENYLEVIRLCTDGEESDKNYRGLVHKWKQFRLQGYEGLGDSESQRKLLLDFVLENEFNYYIKLKELYTSVEWPTVLQTILQSFENRKHVPSTYVEILKTENLTDKLLEYCRMEPSSIQKLYPHLIKNYKDEVNAIFKTYIEIASERANDRKKYKQVCSIIKIYMKACDISSALQLMDELKERNKKRPAFLDELEKLEKTFK
jgi:hypothetical protein